MRVSARRCPVARRLDLRVGRVSGFTVERGQSGATIYRSLYFSADRRADCTGCGMPGCRYGGSPLRRELGALFALAAGRNHSPRYRDLAAAICSYCPSTPAGNTSLRQWKGRCADPRMVRGGTGPAVVVQCLWVIVEGLCTAARHCAAIAQESVAVTGVGRGSCRKMSKAQKKHQRRIRQKYAGAAEQPVPA